MSEQRQVVVGVVEDFHDCRLDWQRWFTFDIVDEGGVKTRVFAVGECLGRLATSGMANGRALSVTLTRAELPAGCGPGLKVLSFEPPTLAEPSKRCFKAS
jgi:hypothetical protein